jgi:hypothetical protein
MCALCDLDARARCAREGEGELGKAILTPRWGAKGRESVFSTTYTPRLSVYPAPIRNSRISNPEISGNPLQTSPAPCTHRQVCRFCYDSSMGWRNGHGTGGPGQVRLEQPGDELPEGTRAAPQRGFARDTSPEAQRLRAQKGGRSKAAWRAAIHPFQKYLDQAGPEAKAIIESAHELAKAEMMGVAKDIGGGVCSVGPSTIIVNAMIAQAAYIELTMKEILAGNLTGIAKHRQLAEIHRLGVTQARALAASEAKSKQADVHGNIQNLAAALSDGGTRAPDGEKLLVAGLVDTVLSSDTMAVDENESTPPDSGGEAEE